MFFSRLFFSTTSIPRMTALEMDCAPPPRWSFTQGLVLGQFSMFVNFRSFPSFRREADSQRCSVLLGIMFLKYVVFEDPAAAREQAKRRAIVRSKVCISPCATYGLLLTPMHYDSAYEIVALPLDLRHSLPMIRLSRSFHVWATISLPTRPNHSIG